MGTTRRTGKTEYVYGNTARELNSVPSREEMCPKTPLTKEEFRELKRREQKADKSGQARKRAHVNVMDIPSLLVLSVSIVVTLYVCISYINAQSEITRMNKETARLESELVTLENENDTALARVNAATDLTRIYKIATKELGMVHADKNHVITYKKPKNEYSRKYADIPDAESDSILGRMLDK